MASIEISSQDLSNYPHGISFVSSVDGRGNFLVFGLFKKSGSGRNGNKRMYKFVGLLCYAGGEFRDGFFQEEITENDIFSLIQMYLKIVHKRIPLIKAPAEDVACFIILHCYDKSMKKKFEIPSLDIQKGVDIFKRVAKYSAYRDNSDYVVKKLGKALREPKFFVLDNRRREFQSWWMELPEMERNKCLKPPPLVVQKAVQNTQEISEQVDDWKVLLTQTMNTEENFERFSSMSRHMGFWYLNTKHPSLKLAATMLQTYDRLLEYRRKGNTFNINNPVISLVVALTQIKMNQQGMCRGQTKPAVKLETTRESCNICGSPVQKGEAENDMTCVTRQGLECFGENTVREVLSVILDDVKAFGLPKEAIKSVKRILSKAFSTFFAHCFTSHLYWKETPTPVMTESLVEACSLNLLRCLIKNPSDWIRVTKTDVQHQMRTICAAKMSEKSIVGVSKHFVGSCDSIGPKHQKYDCLKNHQGKIIAVKAFVMEPMVGAHLKRTWKFISEEKRKKILECNMDVINEAIWGIYKEAMLVFVKKLETQQKLLAHQNGGNKGDDAQACAEAAQQAILRKLAKMHGCEDENCACHNFTKFRQFFVSNLPVINKGDRSFLIWKPASEDEEGGKLILNYTYFLNNHNDNLSDLISGDDRAAFDNIEQNCLVVKGCSRLVSLTETTYYRLFIALKSKIIQEYGDVALLDEYNPASKDYHRNTCVTCGWEETLVDCFSLCGGCKAVYYCSRECQKRHWKSEHRENCKRTFKYETNAVEMLTEKQ